MKQTQWKGGRCDQIHTLREGRGAVLGPGVGVPVAFVLCLLKAVGGWPLGLLATAETPACDGLLVAALAPALEVCLLSRGGCGRTAPTAVGRMNMPYPWSHSKYLSPWTAPSFLPVASVNSTPIQSPTAKLVVPMNRTVPCRPSVKVMTEPGAISRPDIVSAIVANPQ